LLRPSGSSFSLIFSCPLSSHPLCMSTSKHKSLLPSLLYMSSTHINFAVTGM
jgi:hypothetical protein